MKIFRPIIVNLGFLFSIIILFGLQTAQANNYVFDKNFKLLTLDQLEEFVSSNHHLPGVDTPEDLKKQGYGTIINQGFKYLEKIEENVLYLGQLNRQIKAIQEELASKNEKVVAINQRITEIENRMNELMQGKTQSPTSENIQNLKGNL